MTDLEQIAFLNARLDEDEAAAEAAQELAPSDTELAQQAGPCVSDATYAHIERHGPARVLREVEAKRKIVDRCWQALKDQGIWGEDGQADLAVDILRQLASAWSDHPGYRPQWKP